MPVLSSGAAWAVLLVAGLCEIGWAIGLKYTEGFTRLMPSAWTLAAMSASVILLVAIVAAIAITYRGRKPTKATYPAKQLRVRAQDRMRVLQMPAEKQD